MRYHLTWILTALALILPVTAIYFYNNPLTRVEISYPANPGPMARPDVTQRLLEARKYGDKRDYERAIKKAEAAARLKDLTPYDTYAIQSAIAGLNAETGNPQATAEALEKALATGFTPVDDIPVNMKRATQFYYSAKNYPKAVAMGRRYTASYGPDTDTQITVAQSYYMQKDYTSAAAEMQTVIGRLSQTYQPLKEEWIKLWLSAEYEARNLNGQEAALEELMRHYPTKEYGELLEKVRLSRKAD